MHGCLHASDYHAGVHVHVEVLAHRIHNTTMIAALCVCVAGQPLTHPSSHAIAARVWRKFASRTALNTCERHQWHHYVYFVEWKMKSQRQWWPRILIGSISLMKIAGLCHTVLARAEKISYNGPTICLISPRCLPSFMLEIERTTFYSPYMSSWMLGSFVFSILICALYNSLLVDLH